MEVHRPRYVLDEIPCRGAVIYVRVAHFALPYLGPEAVQAGRGGGGGPAARDECGVDHSFPFVGGDRLLEQIHLNPLLTRADLRQRWVHVHPGHIFLFHPLVGANQVPDLVAAPFLSEDGDQLVAFESFNTGVDRTLWHDRGLHPAVDPGEGMLRLLGEVDALEVGRVGERQRVGGDKFLLVDLVPSLSLVFDQATYADPPVAGEHRAHGRQPHCSLHRVAVDVQRQGSDVGVGVRDDFIVFVVWEFKHG